MARVPRLIPRRRCSLACLAVFIILPLLAAATSSHKISSSSSSKRSSKTTTQAQSDDDGSSDDKPAAPRSKKSGTTKKTSASSNKSSGSNSTRKTARAKSSDDDDSDSKAGSSKSSGSGSKGKSSRAKATSSSRKTASSGSGSHKGSTRRATTTASSSRSRKTIHKAPAESDDSEKHIVDREDRESATAPSAAPSAASVTASDSGAATVAAVSQAATTPGKTKLDQIAPFRRCLWVSRFEYQSEADVAKICYNAASARFTDLMFQVRGAGSVGYKSAYEPWAPQLAGSIGANPGYDPLATAIREAHKYGLRVHAYMNVLPGASSGDERSTPLYLQHRSWFMVSAGGYTMSPNGFYAFLDPGLPEVREYLARVFGEVAAKYAVDGIHLDYIRYPEEKGDYSYHPEVVAAFRQLTSGSPQGNPEAWAEFRRQQVTKTVAAITSAVRKARPGIEVTASVIADRNRGYSQAYQPGLEWVRSGLLDAIAPMAYAGQMERFEDLCEPYREAAVRGHVWIGIWAERGKNDHVEDQVRRAISMKFGAVSVFSYGDLFPEHRASTKAVGVYKAFVNRQTMVSMAQE